MKTDETNWTAWLAECDKAEVGLDLEHAVAYLQMPTWELRDLIADLRDLSAEPVCPECGSRLIGVREVDGYDGRAWYARCDHWKCHWQGTAHDSLHQAILHARPRHG